MASKYVTDGSIRYRMSYQQHQQWYDWGDWDVPTYYSGTTTITGLTGRQRYTWHQWTDTTNSAEWREVGTTTTAYTLPNISVNQRIVWDEWHQLGHGTEDEFRRQAEEVRRRNQELWDREQAGREQRSRERLAAQVQLSKAQERAMELLNLLITPDEKRNVADRNEIHLVGSDGRMYIIELRSSVHGNVVLTDAHGCQLGRVCVAPDMYDREARAALPLADGWVGQYLGLKFNAEELCRVGNWSRVQECRHQDVPVLKVA